MFKRINTRMDMKEFKPILVDTDEQGLKHAQKLADEKLKLFNEAVEWCEKHIVVDDLKAFEDDMLTYFDQQILEQHGHKIALKVSAKKLMDMMDIERSTLTTKAEVYYSNPATIIIRNGKPTTKVNKKSYERWTIDAIENDMVECANNFIKAFNDVTKYTKVYPADICHGTNNFVRFDIGKGELKYNPNRG